MSLKPALKACRRFVLFPAITMSANLILTALILTVSLAVFFRFTAVQLQFYTPHHISWWAGAQQQLDEGVQINSKGLHRIVGISYSVSLLIKKGGISFNVFQRCFSLSLLSFTKIGQVNKRGLFFCNCYAFSCIIDCLKSTFCSTSTH